MSKYEIIISIFFLRASRSCSHAQKTAGNALCTAAPMQEIVRLALTVPLAAAAIAVAMKCTSSAAAAVPKQQTATFQTTSTSFAAVIAARVSHSSWAADPESQTTAAMSGSRSRAAAQQPEGRIRPAPQQQPQTSHWLGQRGWSVWGAFFLLFAKSKTLAENVAKTMVV